MTTDTNVPTFALGDRGKIYSQLVQNTQNQFNEFPLDLTGYTSVSLVFYPPSGKPFEKTATPQDATDLADTAITYTDSAGDTTTETGPWEFAAKVTYANGSTIESSLRAAYNVR